MYRLNELQFGTQNMWLNNNIRNDHAFMEWYIPPQEFRNFWIYF